MPCGTCSSWRRSNCTYTRRPVRTASSPFADRRGQLGLEAVQERLDLVDVACHAVEVRGRQQVRLAAVEGLQVAVTSGNEVGQTAPVTVETPELPARAQAPATRPAAERTPARKRDGPSARVLAPAPARRQPASSAPLSDRGVQVSTWAATPGSGVQLRQSVVEFGEPVLGVVATTTAPYGPPESPHADGGRRPGRRSRWSSTESLRERLAAFGVRRSRLGGADPVGGLDVSGGRICGATASATPPHPARRRRPGLRARWGSPRRDPEPRSGRTPRER